MAKPTENTYRLSVRRKMPAPREVVYQAWIDPQGIREWMCPGDATSERHLGRSRARCAGWRLLPDRNEGQGP